MELQQIVSVNDDILSGTPVFTGTRVPVRSLLDHILAGDGLDDFLDGFPTVAREQAEAFLTLAAQKLLVEVEYARAA